MTDHSWNDKASERETHGHEQGRIFEFDGLFFGAQGSSKNVSISLRKKIKPSKES
jgi:hypothetical protein